MADIEKLVSVISSILFETKQIPTVDKLAAIVKAQAATLALLPNGSNYSDAEIQETIGTIQTRHTTHMGIGVMFEAEDYKPWLADRRGNIDFYYWSRYHELLKEKYSVDVVGKLDTIADHVTNYLVSQQTHVVQLAKTESCWQRVNELPLTLSGSVDGCLSYADEQYHSELIATKNQRVINGIHAQQYVVEKGETYWWKLRNWNETHRIFCSKEAGVLDVACRLSQGKVPSDLQAKLLMNAEKRAIGEGFFVE